MEDSKCLKISAMVKRQCFMEVRKARWIAELRESCKKFLLYFFMHALVLSLGAMLFFYIEHCYSPTSVFPSSVKVNGKKLEAFCKQTQPPEQNATESNVLEKQYTNDANTQAPSYKVYPSRLHQLEREAVSNTGNKKYKKNSVRKSTDITLQQTHEAYSEETGDKDTQKSRYKSPSINILSSLNICENYKQEQNEKYLHVCKLNSQNFLRWLEYVVSVAFTTGYGRVIVQSDAGKVAFCLYCLPAISITMVMLLYPGRILIILTKFSICYVETKCLKRRCVGKLWRKIVIVQVSLVFGMWMSMSELIKRMNYITFLDAAYFSMTSLTTVGFGDFSLSFEELYNKHTAALITVIFTFYLAFSLVSSCISSVVELLHQRPLSKKKQSPKNKNLPAAVICNNMAKM